MEETFGSKLRRRREELGMSLEDLEAKASVGKITIAKAERDEQYPSRLDVICRLAKALEVNTYYLYSPEHMEIISQNEADRVFRELCETLSTEQRVKGILKIIDGVETYQSAK